MGHDDRPAGDQREGRGRLSTPDLDSSGFARSGPDGTVAEDPRRVEKPWGYELIWAHTDLYVGKLLFVKAGEALSLQFHEEKDETLHLLEGRLRLEVGAGLDALTEQTLLEGQSIRIEPGTLHRITAETDCRILEASTAELDDVVRVQDRYGRAPGGSASDPAEPMPETPADGASSVGGSEGA